MNPESGLSRNSKNDQTTQKINRYDYPRKVNKQSELRDGLLSTTK